MANTAQKTISERDILNGETFKVSADSKVNKDILNRGLSKKGTPDERILENVELLDELQKLKREENPEGGYPYPETLEEAIQAIIHLQTVVAGIIVKQNIDDDIDIKNMKHIGNLLQRANELEKHVYGEEGSSCLSLRYTS